MKERNDILFSCRDAALGYAEALTRSSDPEDNRRGGELLRGFGLAAGHIVEVARDFLAQ